MAKLKLPFELERISTSSPAVSTDAIDDRNFQKSQEEVNQIFKSAETKFSEDIEALSAQTSIFDENGVPVSANPISFQSNGEFVIATVDGEGRLLYGIRVDGSVYQCATDDLTQAQIDALNKTIAQLSGQTSIFDESGNTLSENPVHVISNEEFVIATVDAEDKLLYGIRKDGSVYQCAIDDLTQAKFNTLEGFSADTLSSLDELDYAVFPIDLKMTVKANSAVTSNNIEYHIKRKGVTFVPDNITIQRQVGSYGALVQIYSGSTADGTTTATISGNIEGFIAEAVKGNKSKTVTDVKYICYFGANANETVASVEDFSGLTKVQTTSINVTRTIQTNSDEFIWIIVPNVLFINRVTSSGFDVSLNEPVNVTTTLGTFKAYRSKNALDSASWTLKIEGTSNFEFSNKDYTQYYEPATTEENPEYKKVVLDSEDKILWSINVEDEVYSPDLSEYEVEDGTKVSNIVNYITSNPPYSV